MKKLITDSESLNNGLDVLMPELLIQMAYKVIPDETKELLTACGVKFEEKEMNKEV